MLKFEPIFCLFYNISTQIYTYKFVCALGCFGQYTGCIKKMVIELWHAIGHSIFNIQK